ncbi:MAG: transcription antitermination factor NusB [Candidatus Erginobacter occultus]|nr:transcription antitermination factor NusB [Candidatus Erginobacter occultus]
MGYRRQARELAIQFLYGYELNRKEKEEALEEFRAGRRLPEPVRRFAGELIEGVLERLEEIDVRLTAHARNWKLDRMAVVDKQILRLALYELYYREDIPSLVTINEAVEIAKEFSTPQSGRFVNGILDRIREELEETGDGNDS